MSNTTLYYLFSTIAQTLAAISALLAVFTHFKINEIKEFLVGDGKAVFERMKLEEDGHVLPNNNDKFLNRLRDAIGRKSIHGIFEVIELLAKYEKQQGKDEQTNPRGLQYLEKRFIGRVNQISKIKTLTKTSILIAFFAIFISIVALIFVEQIICNCYLNTITIFLTLIATIFSMIYTIVGIYVGLKDQEDV